jgi:hypothetical protein
LGDTQLISELETLVAGTVVSPNRQVILPVSVKF